jgi:hypothetical protein
MFSFIVEQARRQNPTRSVNRLQRVAPVLLALVLFFGVGCVPLIAGYDPVTYKGLTDLKAEMMVCLEKVDPAQPYSESAKKFEDLQLGIEKVYEYEKGKKLNTDTIAQIAEIRDMFHDLTGRYKEETHLSAFYLQERKGQLQTAFDLAIATENSKLKSR